MAETDTAMPADTQRIMLSVRAFLFIAGALMELSGIVLVGSPDLVPQARRLSNWLRLRTRSIADWFLRLLHRTRNGVVVDSGAAGVALGGSASTFKSVDPESSLEEKVAFLLTRDEETQRDVNQLQAQLSEYKREVAGKIDKERGEMRDHVAGALRAAHEAYLPLRITGVFALALGLLLTTAGNFVN